MNPEGNMKVSAKFQSSLSSTFQDIKLCTKNVNLLVVLDEKSKDHRSGNSSNSCLDVSIWTEVVDQNYHRQSLATTGTNKY